MTKIESRVTCPMILLVTLKLLMEAFAFESVCMLHCFKFFLKTKIYHIVNELASICYINFFVLF